MNDRTTSTRQDKPKWSWVGHRSPLMDTREEAEWILDQLSRKLRRELQAAVEESEGEEGIETAGAMEKEVHHHPENRGHKWV